MLLTLLLISALRCYCYRKNSYEFDDYRVKSLSITEEDISLEHQVIQLEEKLPDIWSEYYSIPWDLLNPQDLSVIGLRQFAKLGSYADLESLGPSFSMRLPISKQGLFIPQNTSLLFLFNTSTAHNYPQDIVSNRIRMPKKNNTMDALQVIQTSLPFGLPAFHYVADYSLLVPKTLLDNKMTIVPFHSASRWVRHIGLRRIAIPLSSDMMDDSRLVMAFVFRSAKSLDDFVEEEELDSMMRMSQENAQENATENNYKKAKAYIDESLLLSSSDVAKAVIASSSEFFDNFARKWVASVGYESLLYSTFCQVNCRYHEQSYCLKFREGHHATVSLLNIPTDNLNNGNNLQKRTELYEESDRFQDMYDDHIPLRNIRELMTNVRGMALGHKSLSENI